MHLHLLLLAGNVFLKHLCFLLQPATGTQVQQKGGKERDRAQKRE
jgi:hypothetical protein